MGRAMSRVMTPAELAEETVTRLRTAYEPAASAERAAGQARYMRDQFPFLGLATPERRRLMKQALRELAPQGETELATVVLRLWAEPEREYQHTGCDLVRHHIGLAGPGFIDVLEELVTTKSWWDTVDALAAHGAGPLVRRHRRQLLPTMEAWSRSENIWLARTAILHQLTYKGSTDEAALFAFCELNAARSDFFIRKAIGWALREHAATDPDAVAAFVATTPELSLLSRKEAMRGVNRARAARS